MKKIDYTRVRRHSAKDLYKLFRLKNKALFLHGKSCLKCGSVKNIEMDHIFPVSVYPQYCFSFSNIQILCSGCNKMKYTKKTDYRLKHNRYEKFSKEKRLEFKKEYKDSLVGNPIIYPDFNSILKIYR